MRSAFAKLVTWVRKHAFVVALATFGVVAVAAATWTAIDVARPPEVASHGHQPYLEAQQRLHVLEARAGLAVLESALTGDRPSSDLAASAERLRSDLAWAVRPSSELARAWTDIDADLEQLTEQILSEAPDAVETLERIRALVADVDGGS